MTLSDLELKRLLPYFMRMDGAVTGLSEGVEQVVKAMLEKIIEFSTWDHIDDLPESELDALAWELYIPWYDSTASIEVKRRIIKQSDQIHAKRGTKWAVEQVISSYFGNGQIEEWFEYGGEPGHFRITSEDPLTNTERRKQFMDALEYVKRKSAWLDEIRILITQTAQLYAGAYLSVGRGITIAPYQPGEVTVPAAYYTGFYQSHGHYLSVAQKEGGI